MKPFHIPRIGALSLPFALAACVPQPRAVEPIEPAPTAAPAPAPMAPVTASTNWMDAAQTPGDWRYTGAAAGGSAQFGTGRGEPRFTMRCDAATQTVVLARPGVTATQMTIRTESQSRNLTAASMRGGSEVRLNANDRLLDAMALSKGRFAVESPGIAPLYLPSWAEVTRVIEDCR